MLKMAALQKKFMGKTKYSESNSYEFDIIDVIDIRFIGYDSWQSNLDFKRYRK